MQKQHFLQIVISWEGRSWTCGITWLYQYLEVSDNVLNAKPEVAESLHDVGQAVNGDDVVKTDEWEDVEP